MSKFIIDKRVFEMLPDACFGAVVAYGIDNKIADATIAEVLAKDVAAAHERLANVNIKEYPPIVHYRTAFQKIGINPNRYANSVEALNKRIASGAPFPSINTIVDTGNAVSLRYTLPIGAHDIDKLGGKDLEVRPACEADTFIPFGETAEESVPLNELVYVSGNAVRTRRWIWRQSEVGKIDETSANVVFPIDGFLNANDGAVKKAVADLTELLTSVLKCEVKSDFLTKEHNFIEL